MPKKIPKRKRCEYVVWIEIEQQDRASDTYETMDAPFGSTARFTSYDAAVAYAEKLHEGAPLP